MPLPALIFPFSANTFSNKLAPNVPNNIFRKARFCYFSSFLVVSLTFFINIPNFSRDLIICMISFISPLESINVALPDVFNPKDIETL